MLIRKDRASGCLGFSSLPSLGQEGQGGARLSVASAGSPSLERRAALLQQVGPVVLPEVYAAISFWTFLFSWRGRRGTVVG